MHQSGIQQGSKTPFQAVKRQQIANAVKGRFAPVARRPYSSEMANAMVEVSKNIGMGNAAIGLGGGKSYLFIIFF